MRDPAKLEGGDVMRVGRHLFAGLSNRTDAAGVAQLAAQVFEDRPVAVAHGGAVMPAQMVVQFALDMVVVQQRVVDVEQEDDIVHLGHPLAAVVDIARGGGSV